MEFEYQKEIVERMEKVRKRAEDKILYDLELFDISTSLKNGDYDDSPNPLYQRMAHLNKKKLQLQKQSPTSEVMMVSINTPNQDPDDTDFLDYFLQQIEKFIKRTFVKGYLYNIEFYTNGDNHLHTHILIYTANCISTSKLRECARSTFKHCVKNPKDIRQIHVSPISDQKIQEKVEYLKGVKIPEKMDCVQDDIIYRESVGLDQFYTDDFDFTQLYQDLKKSQ